MNGDQKAHQLIALEALQELDRIFKEHDISYFLLAGSTLGAVRHKGFIPWDDDIDIGIFLKDKEKASLVLEKELSSKFSWLDGRVKSNYPRFYGKVLHNSQGCIDVFLLVKTSDSEFKRKIHWFKRKLLTKVYQAKIGYNDMNIPDSLKKRISVMSGKLLAACLPLDTIMQLVKRNELKYEHQKDNRYYINMYSRYKLERELIRSEWISEPQYVTFETGTFPTVNDMDAYLTHLYGDYMTPPPESERRAIHVELFEEDK